MRRSPQPERLDDRAPVGVDQLAPARRQVAQQRALGNTELALDRVKLQPRGRDSSP